jgi:hypothetical protein
MFKVPGSGLFFCILSFIFQSCPLAKTQPFQKRGEYHFFLIFLPYLAGFSFRSMHIFRFWNINGLKFNFQIVLPKETGLGRCGG